MATLTTYKTGKVEKLIINLLKAEKKPIDIHDLFDKAEEKNYLAAYEFKYAFSHLLANQLITLDYDGNVTIKK